MTVHHPSGDIRQRVKNAVEVEGRGHGWYLDREPSPWTQ